MYAPSRTLVSAVLVGTSMHPAIASSIALREGSADWSANAFAGKSAKAYDASTAFSNPAGMTRLNWNETDLSFTLVAPSSNFSGTNTIGGQITPGSQGGHYAQPFVIPSVFAVWNASTDLKLGIAITAPFGARLAYSQDFVGRYQSVVSNLSDVQVSLTGAYRINEHLSVGGGPVINFLSIRLTQAVNLGGLSSAFGDPIADFNGSSVGAGFALGALYEFDEFVPCRNSLPIPHPTHRHGHATSRILPIDRRRKPGDRGRLVRERRISQFSVLAARQLQPWVLQTDRRTMVCYGRSSVDGLVAGGYLGDHTRQSGAGYCAAGELAQHVVWRNRRQLSSDQEATASGRHRIRSVACYRQQSDDPNSRCQSVLGGRRDHLQSIDECQRAICRPSGVQRCRKDRQFSIAYCRSDTGHISYTGDYC